MTGRRAIGSTDVLLVVDVQNDFCPGGGLAVPSGHEVVPLINRLAQRFEHVVLTQDWHPPAHQSFASTLFRPRALRNHRGRLRSANPLARSLYPGNARRRLSRGSAVAHAQLILRKGYHRHIDSYSAFFENDRKTHTGLAGYLLERGLARVFVSGLAFDFCVRYSAEDGKREGFDVLVIEDACRGIDVAGSMDATRRSFRELGIACMAGNSIG